MSPHAPQAKCTALASTTSSTFKMLRTNEAQAVYTHAPTMPMGTADHGSTVAQPAVMDTRPARAPLSVCSRSRLCRMSLARARLVIAPAAAAIVVVAAARETTLPRPMMPSAEPGLKPYQPTQRMKVPSAWSVAECPGISMTLPSASNLPRRGPTKKAPSSALRPPTMCTAPQPAKSIMPTPRKGVPGVRKGESQPWEDHCQCTTTG
mmetsp:Transcript_15770/g.42385  ORF Transcript_15770/g.42385 Transcript_15770/m.42385 type:complete len:207 (+) Transcript_15770:696-1316(+)